jgi:anti-anti-sigma factor
VSVGESYYRFETVDGCLIVTLLPELNDKQWADIERVGTEIVDRLSTVQSPRLIVDLTPLSYMGSAMVALIVRLYKAVTGRSGQMVVVNQHELVFEVLKLAGLTKLWTIVDSREKAFSTLGIKRRAVAATGGSAPQGGTAMLLAGVIGTVGAVIGLALQFSSQPLVSRKVALLIEVAFAALGMIVGTMILVNQTGGRRNVGIVFLAICLLVVLGGIVAGPEQPGGQNTKPAPNATSTTKPDTVSTLATTTTPIAAKPTVSAAPTAAAVPVTNVSTSAPATATTPAAVSTQPAGSNSKKRKDK